MINISRYLPAFILTICFFLMFSAFNVSAQEKPKDATDATRAANAELLKQLPFSDTASYEAAKKGFIAPLPDNGIIKNEKGEPIWDLSKFAFIKEGEAAPDSVSKGKARWRASE